MDKVHIDKQRPDTIIFREFRRDEYLFVGPRATEIAKAINCHDELVSACQMALNCEIGSEKALEAVLNKVRV